MSDVDWNQSLDFEEGASGDFQENSPSWDHVVMIDTEETSFWIDGAKWEHPQKEDVITEEDLKMTADFFRLKEPDTPVESDKFGDHIDE